jgi:hypothetical protein
LNKGFDIAQSKSYKLKDNNARRVTYGSADLQGFLTEDYACLQPLKDSSETELKSAKCSPFEFLSLYEAHGFSEKFHGILGLSPKKNETMKKQHYLWSLKKHGLIDRAMVSFSLA